MASEKGILDPHGIPDTESDGNTSFLRAARNGQLEKVLEYLKTNIDINTSNANGLNALHLASKDGHVEIVEELLKRGAIVDAATKKGNTALHIASLAGQEEVVKILVQHGASVNVQSQNGFTPLYMAAQENHDNVVKFLLANGANQSLSTEDGFTPLAVAMQQGHDKVVTVLLENDTRGKVRLPALHIAAKKDDVRAAKLLLENDHNPDVTSKSGFTPLHIASHYGNQSIANLLIQKGADVNYSAKHNITPLHVAAKWGKSNMVSLLLEQGAHIEAKTRDGLTPLHCAARSGHEQVVDMLLEKSAPISSKTKNGLAPLHMAAQGDHVDAARILLHHRAPVDEVTVDYLTALHVAAHCGHVRVAKLLLERQADANARALNGFTPLHIACKKNRIKVVELLLKHGACIGATTESGLTPLHVASFMGCMNIVIYLLQNDASPDIPTVRGETPLHLAARANQTDIIRILLRNGAQVDARAREQQTPLHVASRLGNVDIVMLLLQHGAKIDSTTKDMYTALHIAAKEGQDEVAAVLIENGASLNSTTKKGFTPLHLAAKYGHLKVAKLLVQKEAPVDAQGKNGVTPLHVASHYDHQNVALLLLEKGASPHAEAKNGHTPLHIAARKNQMDIANTLLEYGAKPDVESKAGFTPLHLSSQEGHVEISSLLLEHKATPDYQSKNGLTPMHLCAQENQGAVAGLLHKNGANIDTPTKGGYTPLHIASHYGQSDMVKFLLSKGANVKATTSLRYTPLHQAAQQGHANIVNLLLENSAQPNAVTNNGQTPLHIAQKLGYITVIDTLKQVTESLKTPVHSEEKYRVVAPELMHETFLSDSEEEGEDTLLGDQTYRYLTADEMKSLGDDSLPIDVTRDERVDSNRMVGSDDPNAYPPRHIEDSISPEHIHPNYVEYIKKATDNVDITRHPVNIGFLVSFLVDARGGAMRGCRHSGVRVIVPPRCAPSPTRITCRYVRPQRTPHPPPLMEGEALASRVLELGPVGAKFLGPVIIEVPHFAALRGKEREIVILRSDNGESWKEHTVEATEDVLNEVLRDSFDTEDLNQLEDHCGGRTTRIITQDFPQYFAVISRIRQEVHAIGPDGGMVSSTVVPQVQAVFPKGALTKKIKVGLQAQPIDPELTAKLLGHGVAVSPVVTVEPRRRKFHKAITLSMPAPRAHSQGMINQYSGSTTTLRLLCSITGGTSRAQWEDVTGSTPLTFVNDCVSFTTTVSARFWLMDCRNIGDATKMATELYREAIHVPFIAKFVVFAKRIDPLEARLRVFCMTDDKEEKTLEYQEQFTEIAKSRDVEVMEGKSQYIEFVGNLVPITKSGEQLQFSFRAFKENRLPFSVRVKDEHAEAVSRCLFMREPKVQKGEPPQQPICILNIVLPDDIVTDTISLTDSESMRKKYYANENFDYYRQDPRLADISNLLGEDWIELANQLGLTSSEINVIKSEYPDSVAKQAQSMLRMWLSQSGNKVQTNTLENALCVIGREDIVNQCLNVDNRNQEILRIMKEEKEKYRLISDRRNDEKFNQEKISKEEKMAKSFAELDKYSAEEKTFEPSDEEEDFNKTVPERREQIVKRLSTERAVPASSQRVEIVQEITSIKRQSLVEDKIAEVQQKANIEPMKLTTIKPVSKIIQEKMSTAENKEQRTTHIEQKSEQISKILIDAQNMEKRDDSSIHNLDNKEKPDRRDSVLLEEVTQLLETKKPLTRLLSREDSHSPKFSKTPPPSPADFIVKEKQATTNQEWTALEDTEKLSRSEPDTIKNISGKTTPTRCLIMHDVKLTDAKIDPPEVAFPLIESQNFKASQEAAADSEYSGVKISSEKVRVNDKDTSQKLPTTNTQELAILKSSHDCLEHTKKTYGNELPEENLCGKSKNRSSQENSPSRSSLNIPNEDEEKTNNFEEPKNIIHRTTSEFLRKEKEGHEAYDTEVSVVSEPRIAHSMQLKPSRSQEHQDVLRNNVRSESRYEDSYSDNYYIKEMKIQIAPICTREASNEFLKKETEYYDDVMLVGSSNARTAASSHAQDKIKDLSEISDEQLKEGNNNLEKPNDTKSLKSNTKSGFITLFRTKSKNHDRFENGGSETTGLDKEKFALANGKSQTVILPSEHETQTNSSTEELRNSYSKNFADKNEFSTQLRETTSAFLNKELKEYHDAEYPKILSIKQKTDTDLEENSKTVEILNHADEECIEMNQTENRDAGGKKKKSEILSFFKVKSKENNKIENNNGDIGIEQKIINRKISVTDQEMIKDPSEDVEISFTEIAETEAGVDPSHFESEQKIIEQENVNLPTVEDLQKQVENTKRSITSKFVEPPTIKAMNNKETVIGSNKTNKIVVVPQQLQNVTHNFLRNEKTSYDLCPVFKDDGRKSQQDFVPVIENKSDDRVPEAKSKTKDGRIMNNRIQKPESFKYQIKINSKVRNENLITPMMSSFNFLLNEKKNYESNVIPNHLTKTETMNELSKKEGKEPSNICISQNMFDYEFKNSNDKEMGEYIRREDKLTLEVTDQNNSIEFPNDNIPLKNSDSKSGIFSEIYDNRGYLKKLNEETEISSSPEIAFELESNDHIHKNNKEIICEEKPDDTEKQNEISHEKRADSTESSGSNEHRTKNEKDKKEKNSKSTQKSKFNILGYFRKKYKSGKDSEDITREEDEIIQSELKELTSSFLLEERMKYEDDGEKPEKIYNKEIPVENIHEIMISRPLNGKSGKQEIEVVSFVSQSNTSPLEVVEKHIQITPAFLEGEKKYECGKPAVDDQYSFISRSEHLIRNENSEKDFQSNKRNTTDFLRREKMLSDSGYLQERAHILKEAENALKISEIESDSITKPPENVGKKHESIQKNEVSNKDDRNEKVSHRSRDKKPKSKLAFFIKKSRDSEKASKSAKNFEKKEDEEKTKKNEGRFFSSGHKQQDIQGNKNKSSTILGLFKKKNTINKDQTPTYHNADDFMKILEDTKTFLSNENEMYSDGIPTYDEKNNSVNFPHESEENENHLTITSEEVISKVENRPQEAQATDVVELTLPEYTAFDFIREEVENFENSKLPNTSQIDSSIRVETETETIDGDSPKEIITKKIFISEKLVEQKESRGAPIMSHEILKALMKVEKDLQGHVYMEEETDEPSEHGDSNFEKVDTYCGLEMEKYTNETELSRNGEIQEMNEDLVSKMKDTLMKKNNVIEDVSHLEEKFFVPNEMEKHEIVTDLDDSTSDEQSSIDARYPESSGECKRKKYTVSFEDEEANIVKKERENCYKLSKKGSITKFHEQNTTVPDVIYASEDFVEDLKVQFTPHTEETNKSGSAPCAEVNISSNTAKRKPLFKIESEEEAVCENIIDSTVRQRQELDNRLLELRTGTANETTDNIPIRKITVENEKGRIENVDIETIEKKLCDLGVAIDTLEKFEKCENPVEDYTKERKLRRIERKFERMASDAGEKTENTINDQYQELVSQLSQEEVMSFQGEYNNLWDEYTFSKSDEWDSKTPDSQADVLELPQGETSQPTEITDAATTKDRAALSLEKESEDHCRQQPFDQYQLSQEMKDLLKEMEEASKK